MEQIPRMPIGANQIASAYEAVDGDSADLSSRHPLLMIRIHGLCLSSWNVHTAVLVLSAVDPNNLVRNWQGAVDDAHDWPSE